MKLTSWVFAGAAALSALPALADTAPMVRVVEPQGHVLVSTGEGYAPAVADMILPAGSRLHVGAESGATLAFADCSVTLPEMSSYVVPAAAPCGPGLAERPVGSVMIEPASGSFSLGGVDGQAIAVTGAVIGIVGLVTILALNYDEPEKAASPN